MNEAPLGLLFSVLAALILFSGFFSSSETGMMSLNRYRLKHLQKHKHRGAMRAGKLLDRPDARELLSGASLAARARRLIVEIKDLQSIDMDRKVRDTRLNAAVEGFLGRGEPLEIRVRVLHRARIIEHNHELNRKNGVAWVRSAISADGQCGRIDRRRWVGFGHRAKAIEVRFRARERDADADPKRVKS